MQPLTIAYVGNARASWCTEVHVTKSLEALGHRVVFLQEDRTNWRDVPEVVKREGAHLLMHTRTWDTDHDSHRWALETLRDAGVPSAFYHLDRWWGLQREYMVHSEPCFQSSSIVFSPDGGNDDRWAEAGVRHHWMPPGVYGPECTIGQPDPRRYPHDVIFVGSHPYPHPEWEPTRTALIDAMADAFGPRFKVWPGKGRVIRGQQLANLYASTKVVVGDSCLVGTPSRYWSDRVPETLGRGAALVHPWVEGIAEWYPPVSGGMMLYEAGRPDEAVGLVSELLANPEQRVLLASFGQHLVLDRDTYAHRMQTVLDVVEAEFGFPDVAPSPVPLPAVTVIHRPSRQRATFRGDQDNTVGEVWTDDTYRLTAADVRGKVVVDIGANVGAFSVLAARLGAKRVVAYEPHPTTFGLLTANLAANAAKVVEARHLAVTDGQTFVQMQGAGGGAFSEWAASDDPDAIAGVGLAAVLDEVGPVDLLKIDCEGAEFGILAGIEEHRLDEVARIVMEAHGPLMPHLSHLDADGCHVERWGAMVAKLASRGRLEMVCRPMVGGLIFWRRF